MASSNGQEDQIISPFTGECVGVVPLATSEDVDTAIQAAQRAFEKWSRTPAHQRVAILNAAANLAEERAPEIARIISQENGKSLIEAQGEAGRSADIIRLAAFEGSQLYGSTLPLDANKGTGFDKIGFTLRQPVGIVGAISPFNYPALLVLHKIAPALAAGNAVVLKPARATPLTALALAQCFVDAGIPAGVLNVVTGAGSTVGESLAADRRVRKISFTGSTAVGERITEIAGIKKLSLELGASGPVIVAADADIDAAARAIALGGYINAGQVCISAQRIIVDASVHAEFIAALKPLVESISVGDPFAATTTVGTLINESEATRVREAIDTAVAGGAHLVTGGQQDGALIKPAILTKVDPYSPIAQEELFGPAVAVSVAENFGHAIALANSTSYGLGAGVFTNNTAQSIRAMREIESGVIHINWTQLWRADLMPYGGLKASGIGKEGLRSAVEEMTEMKTIIMHGSPWDVQG
ncbi:MAG: aldehyde dehydrogenase family protein [Microbacteriaceae bacterium]